MNYDHYTDPSIAVAVDLINTYGTEPVAAAGHDHQPAGGLAEFLRRHGIDDRGTDASDVSSATELADRLHGVFTTTDPAVAADIVNSVLADARVLPRVSDHDGSGWHLHYHAADARAIDRLAAVAAMGLATALCTGGLQRLGRCDGNACRDVYVDSSRNNRRRFCSDSCGTSVHVAAHRARRRSAGAD